MVEETKIPQEIADTITSSEDMKDHAREMIERLSQQSAPSSVKSRVTCFNCGQKVLYIEGKMEKCMSCTRSLTELAIHPIQNDKRKSESLITDPKTKKQSKILEVPQIVWKSAIAGVTPREIKDLLLARREHQRKLLKQKNVREVTPNETRTQILKDLQSACATWEKLFGTYIDQGTPLFRTEFLSESYANREFESGKYKIIVTAIKDLMDTLIDLGEVPEEYFMNYKEYYEKAMTAIGNTGMIYANRVVAFASYYVQSPRSTVVTKRIARSIG